MKSTLRSHKWFTGACSIVLLAGLLVAIMMVKPPVSKAFALVELPAFVFPQVTLHGGQGVQICGSNMGDGSVKGLIGLLDAADTTKALVSMPFELKAHAGMCVSLPGGRGAGNVATPMPEQVSVIAIIAFQNSTQWSATGKTFIASLQMREGNSTKFVLAPMFLSAVPIPSPTN